jgi:two-component system sensor histidine kinase PilS (NtrC family)
MCGTYLLATLAVRLLVRPPRPATPSTRNGSPPSVSTCWCFPRCSFLQVGGINYAPLFAMPVLMAAVLGSTLLALGTAAGVTLLLLAEAWVLVAAVVGRPGARASCRPA